MPFLNDNEFTNLLLLRNEANYVDCQTSTRLKEVYPPIPMFSLGLLIGKRPFLDGAMSG